MSAETKLIEPLKQIANASFEWVNESMNSGVSATRAVTFLMLAFMVSLTVSISGCTAYNSTLPFSVAETVEQRAFAAYGTFVITEERAVAIVRNPKIPKYIRKRIQTADRIAKPLADKLRQSAVFLVKLRQDFKSGKVKEIVLTETTAQVSEDLAKFEPVMTNLTKSLEGVSG